MNVGAVDETGDRAAGGGVVVAHQRAAHLVGAPVDAGDRASDGTSGHTSVRALAIAYELVERVGGRLLVMSAEHHDQLAALISHLRMVDISFSNGMIERGARWQKKTTAQAGSQRQWRI